MDSQIGVAGTPIDINKLDDICKILDDSQRYSPIQVQEANNQILSFCQREDAWEFTPKILDTSSSSHLKFFAAKILRDLVSTKWELVNPEIRESIKNFIIMHVCSWAGDESFNQAVLSEADMVLVLIIVREWPQRWPSVMGDLLNAAISTTPSVCKNNLKIITFISEQIIDFGESNLTSTRISQVSSALTQISPMIFQLIDNVLQGTQDVDIICECLTTLKSIVRWLDPHFIFETELPKALCTNFLPIPQFQVQVLSFFGEVASLPKVPDQYVGIFPAIFSAVVSSLSNPNTDFIQLALQNSLYTKTFVFTLSAFISQYAPIIESSGQFEQLKLSLSWIVELMKGVDLDNFLTICDLWEHISRRIYTEKPGNVIMFYNGFFPIVRRILVARMERPNEILIVENEDGSVSKEETRNTITLALYNTMRKTLVYLANIDHIDTINAILERIPLLEKEWNISILNTMCWSAGAISGTLPPKEEERFVLEVLKPLLAFMTQRTNPDEQAIISSCIMFVCSQYPRFLSEHWNIMKIIVEKLFQFMNFNFEGIQEMAVNSFRKIAQKCSKSFIFYHTGENEFYLQSILNKLDGMISNLSLSNMVTIYDSMAIIIASDKNEEQKVLHTRMLMERMNERWVQQLQQFNPQNNMLLRNILFILRCNYVVAANIQSSYQLQLQLIFQQTLELYDKCSKQLNEMCRTIGQPAPGYETFRIIKEIKSTIIQIYLTFIKNSQNIAMIQNQILPPITPILIEYPQSNPYCRVHQVIDLVSTITEKVKEAMAPNVPDYIISIFLPTVQMIGNDFDEFIEFRIPISDFLKQIIINCPQSILALTPEQIQIIEGLIEWGCTHPNQDICISYLELMLIFIQMAENCSNIQFRNYFFETFYDSIFIKTFIVMTDTIHKFAFTQQVNLFQKLFTLRVEQNNPERIANVIYQQFQNRELQFYLLVFTRLAALAHMPIEFRATMRDLLIEMRQYSREDPDLFVEEREQEMRRLEEENSRIPGYNGPEDVDYSQIDF
ncbi:CRM1 C terminal-domain-containing protein [Histomonas meleagridis]|uniref:CRM1 C terminal-domain-containing protein n=1 Tax=Histomonas meleagridis TaxID=135588 RepID=UPI00355ACA57|nr:CRM1 C terminal-domain-containing protein [Histomonas meleagridis]KAH0805987.1 CRM1 C terminal-domain-containing protein [Histomonas meleagridis]